MSTAERLTNGRRDPRTYGKECGHFDPVMSYCHRKAHGIDSNGMLACKSHGDWLPF